ncbi:MAG: hypothetical protein KF858_12070 [Candidatus Sumerlaeia bacterium]|nr:hypothetical protein [Candidatus Sumerlaeia bacterium]
MTADTPAEAPRLRDALRRQAVPLLGILLAAALLRFWDLGGNPPGLFRDEAEKGTTAFELWHTGRHGEFRDGLVVPTRLLPAFVEVGGVETSAIYQYLSAPIVGLFGLNRTTTRLVAALAGWLTVLLAWALAFRLQAGGHLAWRRGSGPSAASAFCGVVPLAAAAFVAVSPAHVLFSRWAQQGITVPLFFTAGVLAVLTVPLALDRHRRALAASAGLLLALAFYAYEPARLVVPFILLGLWWEMGGDLRRLIRVYWPAAVLFFLFAIPIVLFAATAGSARFARISVFGDGVTFAAFVQFAANYLAHFDPAFLFVSGDANPRHGLPWGGIVGWAEAPFFLAGLWTLRARAGAGARLLIVWLFAAPLAAAMTNDGIPHALRAILFLPAVHLISARGVGVLVAVAGARLAAGALVLVTVFSFALDATALRRRVALDGFAWQYGVLEALDVMWRENPDGPNVLYTDYAPYYALFFEQPDPRLFHEHGLDALRTVLLPRGATLPVGALVASPPFDLFAKTQPLDVPALGGDPSAAPAMQVRPRW